MQLLVKRELGFSKKYVYLFAIIISFIVLLQVSNTSGGKLYVFLGHIILFVSNYLVWAFLIEYINGASHPFRFKSDVSRSIILSALAIVVIVVFHLIFTNILYYGYLIITTGISISDAIQSFKPYILRSVLSRLLDLGIIIVLLRIIETFRALQEKKLQVLSLEKNLHQSQLMALQTQLNPHFLFNALHTLNTLIGYDNDKAQSMLIKITQLLRKILSHKETPYISLKEELDYVQNYLDIEMERFNDRLKLIINIDEEANDIMVPTLMLQPLIENAFKHGISYMDEEATIELNIEIQQKDLFISLSNSIPKEEKMPIHSSNGIGLENLKQRLKSSYGENYRFTYQKLDEKYVVTIVLKDIHQ